MPPPWVIPVFQFLLTVIIGLVGWNYRAMVGKVLEAVAELKEDMKEEQGKHQENRERIIRLEGGAMNGFNVRVDLAEIRKELVEIARRLERHHAIAESLSKRIEVVAGICQDCRNREV